METGRQKSRLLVWLKFAGKVTKRRELCVDGAPKFYIKVPLNILLNSRLCMYGERLNKARQNKYWKEIIEKATIWNSKLNKYLRPIKSGDFEC